MHNGYAPPRATFSEFLNEWFGQSSRLLVHLNVPAAPTMRNQNLSFYSGFELAVRLKFRVGHCVDFINLSCNYKSATCEHPETKSTCASRATVSNWYVLPSHNYLAS